MNGAACSDFLMPALGADMETGKVVQWNVQPGQRVKPGDVVCVVETQKGAIDVEIFLDGVIGDLAALGIEMPVGAVLAHVRGEGAATPPTPPPRPMPSTSASPLPPPARTPAHARASPAARRRAAERGLAIDGLSGSGPEGAVTLADVERAAAAPAPAAPRAGFDPAQMRQAIAAAMGRSKREIPHYYLGSTIDFTAAARWLEAYNRERPPPGRLLPAVLLLKAAARALAAVPGFNGWYQDGRFVPGEGVHLGWAIALRGGGLIAPAIHDAERLALPVLMDALRDLVARARSGGLRSSELTDATVTVTSLGERGAETVQGVIYPPQVALVGFGRIADRPWVVDGQVVARPLVNASLAADHRVSDGHQGARLLEALDAALQAPDRLQEP